MKIALGIAAIVVFATVAFQTLPPAEGRPIVRDDDVESFDGTRIAVTVFKPGAASAEAPVPIIVRSHGWAGSRGTTIGPYERAFLDAGYGVLTFDARGHGDSGGLARVQDPAHEIRDVAAVFDWIHDELDWVAKEPRSGKAKDVVAGGSGYSYGGAWQLLFAAIDGRIDAIQPDITWHSLPQALAPNGAVNSAWVHLLYGSGKANARLDPAIDRWYAEIMATNEPPPDALAHFENASLPVRAADLRTPALLTQGVPDTLFNLNQAIANFETLRANGVDARLFTHLNGHLLNPSLVDGRVPDAGFPQPGERGSPCGDPIAEAVRWYDRHLRGLDVDVGAPVSFAMDDGTCVRLDAIPEASDAREVAPAVTLPPNAGSVVLPILTSEGTTRLAGVPRLAFASATVAGVDDVLYASLLVLPADGGAPRVADAQVTPLRLSGPYSGAVEVDLGGVAIVLRDGDALALRLDRVSPTHATNAGRLPSLVVAQGVSVALPVLAEA